MEYDFIVDPFTNYQPIGFKFNKVTHIEDTTNNDLLVHYGQSVFKQQAPFTYQFVEGQRREIKSAYCLVKWNK